MKKDITRFYFCFWTSSVLCIYNNFDNENNIYLEVINGAHDKNLFSVETYFSYQCSGFNFFFRLFSLRISPSHGSFFVSYSKGLLTRWSSFIKSAPRSPIIIAGVAVLPETISGILNNQKNIKFRLVKFIVGKSMKFWWKCDWISLS